MNHFWTSEWQIGWINFLGLGKIFTLYPLSDFVHYSRFYSWLQKSYITHFTHFRYIHFPHFLSFKPKNSLQPKPLFLINNGFSTTTIIFSTRTRTTSSTRANKRRNSITYTFCPVNQLEVLWELMVDVDNLKENENNLTEGIRTQGWEGYFGRLKWPVYEEEFFLSLIIFLPDRNWKLEQWSGKRNI